MNAPLILLADRLFNRPLLITPDKARVILSVLSDRLGVNDMPMPSLDRFEGDDIIRDDQGNAVRDARGRVRKYPYRLTEDGIAIISVVGSLVSRGAWLGAPSGLVSFEALRHQLKSAALNEKVKGMVLDMESPGGEVTGTFETAAMIKEISERKPVYAVVNGMAASAAYALISGAGKIVTTQTGMSGSIGVVLIHVDYSRQLNMSGITPTLIHAGRHKVDGNALTPLADDVREELQGQINQVYEQFLDVVQQGRGRKLDMDTARATEARCYFGADAIDQGFADEMGSFENALDEITRLVSRTSPRQPTALSIEAPKRRTTKMPEVKTNPEFQSDEPTPQAIVTTSSAPQPISQGAEQATVSPLKQDGAERERARFAALIQAPALKEQPMKLKAALDLAVRSPTMSTEDILAFVSANVAGITENRASLARRHEEPDSLGELAAGSHATPSKSGWSAIITNMQK